MSTHAVFRGILSAVHPCVVLFCRFVDDDPVLFCICDDARIPPAQDLCVNTDQIPQIVSIHYRAKDLTGT